MPASCPANGPALGGLVRGFGTGCSGYIPSGWPREMSKGPVLDKRDSSSEVVCVSGNKG